MPRLPAILHTETINIAPGVAIGLQITRDGRLKLLAPAGPLDVTDASSTLGTGLHVAGALAAQIRVRRAQRRRSL